MKAAVVLSVLAIGVGAFAYFSEDLFHWWVNVNFKDSPQGLVWNRAN